MTIFSILTLFVFVSFSQRPAIPFPHHVQYRPGTIKPNHISQSQMDDSVRSFYTHWRSRYIHNDCGPGQYYVWFGTGNKKCVSEGQGYGMIIVALMAGFDDSAKIIYDGLFKYFRSHRSKQSTNLMAWAQTKDCKDLDQTTATDGDMDIAYSLLLANQQWGSKGHINYIYEARKMITDIMKQEINHKTFSILMSNAIEFDSKDFFDMRSSDFMPAHLKAFRTITADSSWNKVIGSNYKLFQYLQDTYSTEAGLIPDFINHINSKAKPAEPRYLESRYDGMYNYNACRIPWRIATDFLLNGDKRAKAIVEKINHWIKETTNGNPDNISAGYTLAGDDLRTRHFEALSFITPFAVSAMVSKDHQQWLNNLWDYITKFKLEEFDYYDNSIKMINLIILSGNYWNPN